MGMTFEEESNEQFRMMNAARNSSVNLDDLLDELLDGEPRTVQVVLKMRAFWKKNEDRGFHGWHEGYQDAGGSWKVLAAIDKFLKSQLSESEFQRATAPPSRDPKATTILTEFDW